MVGFREKSPTKKALHFLTTVEKSPTLVYQTVEKSPTFKRLFISEKLVMHQVT